MDEDLYDEFGNLIGDPGSASDSSSDEEMVHTNDENQEQSAPQTTQIVLHEDKKHYASLKEVFGDDVETIVATSDAKDISEPTVEPQVEHTFKIEEQELPPTRYSKEYMWQTARLPAKVRNVALCGSLHSGKTSFLDMLVYESHTLSRPSTLKNYKPLRYTDNHKIEVHRGVSIKSSTMTLLLPNLRGSSLVTSVVDAPGHVNFVDELAVSVRLSDTVVLVVDAVEGLTKGLELAISHALVTNTPLCVNISKIDRLVMELRLPPLDAYYKIRKVLEEINDFIAESEIVRCGKYTHVSQLSPELNNVCFSSATLDVCFSLRSFSQLYIERRGLKRTSVDALAARFWGDVYYIDGKFTVNPENRTAAARHRTFVSFILEPIYKLVTITLTREPKELERYLRNDLGITTVHRSKFKMDAQLLLKEVFSAFFGDCSAPFADILEKATPSPAENSMAKLESISPSKPVPWIAEAVRNCDPEGPLIAYVAKLVDTADAKRFYAQVRVLSGTLKPSSSILLLGESYSTEFDEDLKVQDVRKTFLSCGRYRIDVDGIPAGSIGLISGHDIDYFISKTATIFGTASKKQKLAIFKPLDRISKPVFKVAVQPVSPSEFSKFVEGLKKLNRSYIGSEIKVEEGGEHVIFGYGELYLDCLLHDLRHLYAELDIKVSDPMTRFAETCLEMSKVKLTQESNNKKNSITIVAESLDEQIAIDIESGVLSTTESSRNLAKHFKTQYGWDSLAARSIWSFGPEDSTGTSILCDDTLPDEVDKKRLIAVEDSIVQGFKWATREGPLCDEPIRETKFRIIDIQLSSNYLESNGAQIIQMVRKACYSAFMTAVPRLLEPIYEIEVTCLSSVLPALSKLLDKRRGSILSDKPIAGTPLFKVVGSVPVIESVGLETDIRLLTQGQAMCQMIFSKWAVTPGDPLDQSCFIPVLKPAPIRSLARDFTIKTRKRKGLEDEPSLKHYVDHITFDKLKAAGIVEG